MLFSVFSRLIDEGLSKLLTVNVEKKDISKMDELVYAPNTIASNTHLFDFKKYFVPQHAQMWMKDHFRYCFLCCALFAILSGR